MPGAALRTKADVFEAGAPIGLSVASTGAGKVTLSQRERVLSSFEIGAPTIAAGLAVELDAKDADGVLIATVWILKGAPLAERLLFRVSAHALSVELKADKVIAMCRATSSRCRSRRRVTASPSPRSSG